MRDALPRRVSKIRGVVKEILMLRGIFTNKDKQPNADVVFEQEDYYLFVKVLVSGKRIASMNCVIEDDRRILIGDIHHKDSKDYDKGFGSVMMNKLIEYAKENGYVEIYGNLSVTDSDHKERLHHFYAKFGFDIIEYSEVRDMFYGAVRRKI